jgi:hypothetical protein
MTNVVRKSQVIGLALLGLLIILPACTHRSVRQVGTHKVTVLRHGLEKKVNAEKDPNNFEYAGVGLTGQKLKVRITGDKVMVNGVDFGMLRPGDSLQISDEGVAVNSMDYVESEKYLRANMTAAESTVRN